MSRETIIQQYYELVDKEEYSAMLKLFSLDIVYLRAGKEINGMQALKHFYLEDRKLKGRHTIIDITVKHSTIYVKGRFNGVNGVGEIIDVGFVDYFEVDDNSQIKRRETFLSQGFGLIQ